jgi:hypothetical protein
MIPVVVFLVLWQGRAGHLIKSDRNSLSQSERTLVLEKVSYPMGADPWI